MSESRPGRPTRRAAAELPGRLREAATALFLRDGYAATSMEAIAAAAGVSKRTLYKRYPDKAALLREVIGAMIARWLPGFDQALISAPSPAPPRGGQVHLEHALVAAARRIHAATLAPDALSLYRLLVGESGRFPEIGRAVEDAGINVGVARVAGLLRQHGGIDDPLWAAEQFQRLVLSGPQWRALGFGASLDEAGLDDWARRCVTFFLRGIGVSAGSQTEQKPRDTAAGEHDERMQLRH